MTEAFDTSGNKLPTIGKLIDNTGKNARGEGIIAPAFTKAELAELAATDVKRAQQEADAPYLGWPKRTPMFTNKNPIVNEVAQMLWEAGL